MDQESTRQVEMFYWVQMVNCYDGTDDIASYLSRGGIPYNGEDGQIQVPQSNLVQGIIVNKIAPMAMADVMGWTLGE